MHVHGLAALTALFPVVRQRTPLLPGGPAAHGILLPWQGGRPLAQLLPALRRLHSHPGPSHDRVVGSASPSNPAHTRARASDSHAAECVRTAPCMAGHQQKVRRAGHGQAHRRCPQGWRGARWRSNRRPPPHIAARRASARAHPTIVLLYSDPVRVLAVPPQVALGVRLRWLRVACE